MKEVCDKKLEVLLNGNPSTWSPAANAPRAQKLEKGRGQYRVARTFACEGSVHRHHFSSSITAVETDGIGLESHKSSCAKSSIRTWEKDAEEQPAGAVAHC